MTTLWRLLSLACPLSAAAQTPLSFRDAQALLRRHNERWRAADVSVARAEQVRSAQRGLYLPTVGVLGTYAHLNDRLFVDLSGLRGILTASNPTVPVPALSATVLQNDPAKMSFAASWTVFAGGRIVAANRAAQAGLSAADEERRGAQEGMMTELVDRYYKRRLAADVLEVRKQALATLNRHAEDARRLLEAGQIARTEALRAEVARAEADRDYKKAVRDVDLAAAALRATLGTDADYLPSTPLHAPTGPLEPRERFAAVADTANADIARLTALQQLSRQGVTAARAEYFPIVRLFGQREIFQSRLNTTADPEWFVGVELRWNLFDGFRREHRLSEALLIEEELALRREGAQRDVRTLVQSRYDEYASAVEQYESLQSSLELATESLRSEQRAFTEGVGTSLAVVDAELSLSRIQVGRLTALYDMTVALARLLEASGQSDRILEYSEP